MESFKKLYVEALNKYVFPKNIFYNMVETMDDSELMAKVFEYCVIMRKTEGLDEYLSYRGDKTEFFKQKIADEFGIVNMDSEEGLTFIRDYLKEKVLDDGYVCHTTNGLYSESIMRSGLTYQENKNQTSNVLEEMKSIFPETFFKTDLNYLEGQTDDREGWYYDRTPYHYKRYRNGPEWFKRLTNNNYSVRNYEGAKKFILMIMNDANASEEKKEKALQFLDKYWQKFAPTTPHLLLISTKGHELRPKEEQEILVNLDLETQIKYLTDYYFRMTDQVTKETIPPEDIIDLDMYELEYEYNNQKDENIKGETK